MFMIQFYSIIKEFFGQMGIKDKEACEKSYEEMYDSEYLQHLEDICNSLHIKCDLEYDNTDELCKKVFHTQDMIDQKIRKILKKIED